MTTLNTESPMTEMNAKPSQSSTRKVYNGSALGQKEDSTVRGNRPLKSRRRSPLNIIAIIFLTSILIVFYIWNKICVNKLAIEVNDLQNHYEKILNTNEYLRADINKKSSLERIEKKIISERLALVSPKEQPVWFELNESRLDRIQQ